MSAHRREPPQVPTALPLRRRVTGALLAAAVAAAGTVLFACTAAPGRPGHDHGAVAGGRSVTALVDPSTGPADVHIDLDARAARIPLSTGQAIDAWTWNGTAPGPQITVRRGQLLEVAVRNTDVEAGVTVHWHGLDVPNAMDGVAGVTQDAVSPGGEFTYRFRPQQVGTFWYHTHQVSSVGVARGLFGAIVVLPSDSPRDSTSDSPGAPTTASTTDSTTDSPGAPARGELDRVLLAHTWAVRGHADVITIGADAGQSVSSVASGTRVRLRLSNTDSLPQHWAVAGTAFAVTAIDGTDVHGPTLLHGSTLTIGGGGRYDIAFTMPASPVSVGLLDGNRPSRVLRPPGTTATTGAPVLGNGPAFDPLSYGTPSAVPFTMDSRYDVQAVQRLETHRVFSGGIPRTYWTINGRRAPDVPMITVADGDAVRVHLVNDSDTIHPMHLHGHHVLVLQRNGVRASGSPWWADTVNLDPGDDVWVAFRADNPGIWMDHCHNLVHAAAGMLMHVAYRGISTPFHSGGHNKPE